MVTGITRNEGSSAQRRAVRDWLAGLERLSPSMAEMVVTAWVSAWTSSPFATLEEMPYSTLAPDHRLMDHVNHVTRAGLDLAARAGADWGVAVEPDILGAILMLHDVDKPLMYVRQDGTVRGSPLSRELPHGVPGAMLLREMGFPHRVVHTVATHAHNQPFHGTNPEAWILHYADFFATDRALLLAGTQPFYQRRH
ncbi:HDIG domain-containing protein [Roseomonas rosea]|jgi:putative nucleotidyltransferase with HDIG domain|uniref:HDIG domain-containing protein n=1 Tax=Muricoccus roseus TaxID=198092 RepID=A0A1M6KZA3_9PROT|nr:HDIG domain-containing metalloprotein [Roseomonas rosea]SHJ64298.1 HDIG domain-containing protein [Roseomonas rosea]